uniref:Uncharacterized protein n=2 Tax=Cercopithecinae TaxID=9528 RepID=A0A2K5YYA7_MANLE
MRVIAGLPLRLVTPPCWGPTGEAEQVEGLPVCPPWPASLPLLCVWEHLARNPVGCLPTYKVVYKLLSWPLHSNSNVYFIV